MGSYKKKKNQTGSKSSETPPKRRLSFKWIVLIVAVLTAAVSLVVYHFQPTGSDQMPVSPAGQPKSGPTVEFNKLIGRWLRPDGGYVIEIRNISSGGKMEAAYFNPLISSAL